MYSRLVGLSIMLGICLVCAFFMTGAGLIAVKRTRDRQFEAILHVIVLILRYALTMFGVAFLADDIVRTRTLAHCCILARSTIILFAFPRNLSYACLVFYTATDVGAQMLADSVNKTETPSRIYITLMAFNILFVSILEVTIEPFRMLYEAQEELFFEKRLLQKMLGMLCDGSMTVGEDADTILGCDERFDHLMEGFMEGESLMKYIPESEKDQERERVKQAFKRALTEPVIIPTTLIGRSMFARTAELVILYRGSAWQSEGQPVLPGYIVGIRSISEGARNKDFSFDSEGPAEWHDFSADMGNHEPETCSDYQSSLSLQESLPATTYTSDVFASVDQSIKETHASRTSDIQVQLALQKLIRLGKQEHWLIDSTVVKRNQGLVLGRGGFSIVYSAYMCGVEVAVKVARQTDGKYAKIFQLLSNELRILRHIRHPSIVLFHGAIVNSVTVEIALVLERVQGQELSDFLSACNGPISMNMRLCIIIDVCCALWYLHAQTPQIVYGDLKGSNVLIEQETSGPHAKLLDFGLSRLMTCGAPPLGGTLRWVAPEVLRKPDEKAKASADIFSFGRFIYYVITGLLPLDGVTQRHIMTMAINGEIPPLNWPRTGPIYDKGIAICNRSLVLRASLRPEIAQIHEELVAWRATLNNENCFASDHAVATSSCSPEQHHADAQCCHMVPTVLRGFVSQPEEPSTEQSKPAKAVWGKKQLAL